MHVTRSLMYSNVKYLSQDHLCNKITDKDDTRSIMFSNNKIHITRLHVYSNVIFISLDHLCTGSPVYLE